MLSTPCFLLDFAQKLPFFKENEDFLQFFVIFFEKVLEV